MPIGRRAGICLTLVAAILFLAANRGAYRGYFFDDDLDALSWLQVLPLSDFAWGLLTPRFQVHNFRPLGHLWMYTAHRLFGLDYPGHVALIQLLHLANMILVWLLARRMGAGPVAASAGTLFFGFHMALFDVFWKPMYVFDALCTACVLACVWSYAHRRWVLSFVLFWLGYKAKELAIVAPVILLAWEHWLGDRRYLRTVPFFLVSISFGLQAMLFNPNRDNDYTFRFTPDALARTLPFYAGRVFLLPWSGVAVLLIPLLSRDRRAWLGVAWAASAFAPLLFLPGRIFSAYCYLPFAGLALTVAAITPANLALGLGAIWIAWNLPVLRHQRRLALEHMDANRQFASAILDSRTRLRQVHTIVYDSLPAEFHLWGLHGILRYGLPESRIRVETLAERSPAEALKDPGVALLQWNPQRRNLHVLFRESNRADDPALVMNADTPIWQLGEGWYGLEDTFRWIQPRATAYLRRPAEAERFWLEVNVGPDLLRLAGPATVAVRIGGRAVGSRTFSEPGIARVEWELADRSAGRMLVEFAVSPGYQSGGIEPRELGIAVRGFGFAP